MSSQELELPAAAVVVPAPRRRQRPLPGGARWRALLEQRWKDRLQEVTELSLEFHEAGAAMPRPHTTLQQLMRRAVTARRGLADLDDALGRLATGEYGRCERCSGVIPPESLAVLPEARYCARCAE